MTVIYLEQVPFPLYLLRQSCTNADGSTAVRYLVTSDASLTVDQLLTILPETVESGRVSSLAQTERIPCQITDPHTNHPDQSLVAALWTFTKLEMLKMRTKKNHYALKTQLYLSALQQAFESLCQLDPVRLDLPTA